jgi:hypothetical protein
LVVVPGSSFGVRARMNNGVPRANTADWWLVVSG